MVAPAGGLVVVRIAVRSWICLSPNLQVCRVFDTEATVLGQDLLHKAIIMDFKFVKCSKMTNLHDRRWFSLHKTTLTGKHSLTRKLSFWPTSEKTKIKTQLLPKTTICKCVRLSLLFFFTDCKNLGVHLRHPLCQPIDFQGSEGGLAGGEAQ